MSSSQANRLPSLLSLLMLASTVVPATAQESGPQARLERAREAIGSVEQLTGGRAFAIEGEGSLDLRVLRQGMSPAREERVAARETWAFEPGTGRLVYETQNLVNPDAREHLQYRFDREGREALVDQINRVAFWIDSDGSDGHRERYLRMLPHWLVEEMVRTPHSLSDLGVTQWRDRECRVLEWRGAGETSIEVFFSGEDGVPLGLRYPVDVPLIGPTAVEWIYDSYREAATGARIPEGYRILVAGDELKRMRFRDPVRGGEAEARIEPPSGIEMPALPESPPETESGDESGGTGEQAEPSFDAREIAGGIYLVPNIRNGFHVLFLELEEYVVAVDAPAGFHEYQMIPAVDWGGEGLTSDTIGQRFLDTIRETVPDKPIRYLVLTHHHGDHAGGMRPFLQAGATIVTSAATAPIVADSDRVETVRGERVFEDDSVTVRVLEMGTNPHAEGLLAVHLPRQEILYIVDVFEPAPPEYFPNQARLPAMRWFVEWLDASALEPERIYSIHGSARVTEEQLQTIRSRGAG